MFILKKNAKKFVYTDLMTTASVEEQRIDLKIKVPRENIRILLKGADWDWDWLKRYVKDQAWN